MRNVSDSLRLFALADAREAHAETLATPEARRAERFAAGAVLRAAWRAVTRDGSADAEGAAFLAEAR
jgi:predicted nucleic acid-binding protein